MSLLRASSFVVAALCLGCSSTSENPPNNRTLGPIGTATIPVQTMDKTELQQALEYLHGLPKRMKPTRIGYAPPTGIANYLQKHFGNRLAEGLAKHIAVEGQSCDPHEVLGVLIYLGWAKDPAAAPFVREVVARGG